MTEKFLTGFPDSFLLECRMSMTEELFQYWFEDHHTFIVLGYAKKELLWSKDTDMDNLEVIGEYIHYQGEDYALIFKDLSDDFITASAGFHITQDQIELLKMGKHRV